MLSCVLKRHQLRSVAFRRCLTPPARFSSLSGRYASAMHDKWQMDPTSVHPSWATYFQQSSSKPAVAREVQRVQQPTPGAAKIPPILSTKFVHLKKAFQVRGHEVANLDPLGLTDIPELSNMDPESYGITTDELNTVYNLQSFGYPQPLTLGSAIEKLKTYYCGTVGFQYMHIQDSEKCDWLRSHIEKEVEPLPKEERVTIFERLAFAEKFETFLANKWNTAKRFGVEGCDAMTPGLKTAIDRATELGVNHIAFGMAHRGRLNVLANVIRKPLELIFKEFSGEADPVLDATDWAGSGDVKYHLGTNYEREYPDGRRVHLSLLHNPSHLECVNPLVTGKIKAHMHYSNDEDGSKSMPILIHGDAALAGQGILYESMQLAELEAYQTGGTLHVACNNQIGFTTDPSSSRSTRYCSDIGAAFQTPIFHVNADDPEAVCRAFRIATEYRMRFKADVIVDVIGYRRYGHNELDQPLFTQPVMYHKVAKHPSVLNIHTQRLLNEGVFTQQEIDSVLNKVDQTLSEAAESSLTYEVPKDTWKPKGTLWSTIKNPGELSEVQVTGVPVADLHRLGKGLVDIPEDIKIHRQLKKIYKAKAKAFESGTEVDWGSAESLAVASLLQEGLHVRLTGQDVQRGTFSHRHAVLHCQETNRMYAPINHLEGNKEIWSIYNSCLSEFAVLGFELGYSMETPDALVMWEAQFGDFANGAQVIIDQFLSAQESKWGRQTGLVMLLPHGYEGMGPEHSSCRLERYLSSSNEDPDKIPQRDMQIQSTNWQVVNCTTPANYFHVLRRQLKREFRKPLIVAAPKSLLKLRACQSTFEEMGEGTMFKWVLPETAPEMLVTPEKVRRLVLCSGKVYYELKAAREKQEINDVALVRVEQVCPFPFHDVAEQMELYPNAEVVWCQEEPKNMGAWNYVSDRIKTASRELTGKRIRPAYVGRKPSSSPAEGYGALHAKNQQDLIDTALSNRVIALSRSNR